MLQRLVGLATSITNKIINDLKQLKIAIIIIIFYCTIMQIIFGTVCPVKAFFKIDCPGCGLTHATIELLKGNLKKSFDYNPTCTLWLLSIMLYFIDRYFYKLKIKPFPLLFIITTLVTLIRYFYKIF